MTYNEKYAKYLSMAEKSLNEICTEVLNENSTVASAAKYSLMAGGKRTRAVLCLAVCEMLCGDIALAAQYAAAVEMLHCYSLIHDDLPCMDDDDYRRGNLACHKKYGEATALLAGDALLTGAFEVLSNASGKPEQNISAVKVLSMAAGTKGMIYGQELDLHFENTVAKHQDLLSIHENKTGMLINASAILGAISAEAFKSDKDAISKYAFSIGLVFQMIDDVLDVTSTSEEIGKPVGSDVNSDKTTFVKLFGVEKTLQLAGEETEKACLILKENFEEKADFLIELAQTLLIRKK